MLQWFKKKTAKDKKLLTDDEKPQLTDAEKTALLEKIKEEEALMLQQQQSDKEKALSYEKIGLCYAELDDSDEAIVSLEKSLETKLSMGDGYKKLMSLYNVKRAQAARSKDNDAIDYYMAKMDEMRNIAKKLTLSK
ncbi:tetratricopeptide repeat protein [Streptococcus ratti]|uniref:Tetratricopeptide repeat protein n=1 Tax=Streptococcus ratti TaxID=1341 RepID=A0A7X9LDW0_STRRT|nr:tetratricopeptide repeat protein [Streptococcus ratti]